MSTRKYLSGYEKLLKKRKIKYKNLISNFASQKARKIDLKKNQYIYYLINI